MPMLAHTEVKAAGSSPERWLLVLHGLLGRGGNWRTLTRALVDSHPAWGGVLVDLRMHGASQGFLPPHTVAAAAADLDVLAAQLQGPVEAVIGHSLGGKVAMAWARRPGLRQAFILDASPSARVDGRGSETTREVLDALRDLPARVASREDFIARAEAAGLSAGVARWLAMNLLPGPDGGFLFGLELEAMESLLLDVLRRDDWNVVLSPPAGLRFEFVLGGRSTTVDGEDRIRLRELASAGRLGLTVLPEAGHWLQVDDPLGTLQAISEKLR